MRVQDIVESLLVKRGIKREDIASFLDPSLKQLVKASCIPGLAKATDVIIPFVRDSRPIVVFGDYDCDGVCASAILVMALQRIGAKVSVFLPDRFTEGYGLTPKSIGRMLKENPEVALVITVDCGITSFKEVKTLKERGIAVVVTDHHLPPSVLPECDALVDPKTVEQRDVAEMLGVKDLCGAGVAFFLANMIAARATEIGLYKGEKFGAPLLVLAGLATVVDIVPLTAQNRILVASALKTFRHAPVGLVELLLRAQRRPAELTSRDFGFLLGPRINAAGRMASAREAYDLLMASEREPAREFAQRVDVRNSERKSVEDRMSKEAVSQIAGAAEAAIVVDDGNGFKWHTGVCGIVASRILDKFNVPVAVVVGAHGSARAPEGYDIHAALASCESCLERFGGHKAAGGFTVKEGMLEEFRRAFQDICARQRDESGIVCRDGAIPEPDMWISPSDISMELHEGISRMAPFGEGNPEPVFGVRGIVFSDVKLMGENGKHAAFSFAGQRMPRATWWNKGNEAEKIRSQSASRFDMTFTIDVSDWGSEEPHVELRIRDVCESGEKSF
ncbi:MAG: single-stranded-DNA-specific exonuclease RecJ [Kiritimatiellae bacterium]|nr:single-stranded-DNA-specific exonuclease RecJ [Kiritimatiellia bacterium]